MIGKTLGNFECMALNGRVWMSEDFQKGNQKPGRRSRSRLVLATAVLCLFSGVPQSVKSFAKDKKITPEEVVAKHLKSIGKPEVLGAIKSRAVLGTASFEFVQGGFGSTSNGKSLIVSERRKLGIIMRFNEFHYYGEYIAFDGLKTTVGDLEYNMKSDLANFFREYYGLLEEGLVGGTLSVAWPLLDIKERQPKLKYKKRTVDDQPLHELTYEPKSRIGMLKLRIKLFFDFETFRHVMTEYRYSYSNSSRILLREQFEDFRDTDELVLPHRYTIYYSRESDGSTYIGRWTMEAKQVRRNTQIDPQLFKARTLRTLN